MTGLSKQKPFLLPIRKLRMLLLFIFLIFLFSINGYSQNALVVKGHVVNERGQPISGASVIIKGLSTGASTNTNGDFEINAVPKSVLIVTSVGYLPHEVAVKGNTFLNIALTQSETGLNEVVVIGYGTQRKEAVTGSVASISGKTLLQVPSDNVTQALQGRLAGVEVSQTNSQPGATMQIRIRGQRSLTASNDPLIVLDGIPFTGSIGDINPNDIKSIDVLKDASATAIYGSRGANGVILITTNRGRIGEKPRVSYNGRVGALTLFAKYPMMNGPEFFALRKAAGLYTTLGADEDSTANTDWQKMFFKTGWENSHDVDISGGTQGGNYNFGLGYYNNQGVVPTQGYKRYSMRFAIDQEVGKYFRFGLTTNNNYNLTTGSQVGLYNILSMSPIAVPYNPDGTLKRSIQMPLDNQFVQTKSVVDSLKNEWLNETRGYATYNSAYGEVKIPGIQGLKYRFNLGLDFVKDDNGAFTGPGVGSSNPTTPSSASVDNQTTYHWTMENLLTYDHTFAQKHTLNVVALYSAEQNKICEVKHVSAKYSVRCFSIL
jgi:TonB-dependent starch-binding outer membrane protein SusC